MLTMKLSCTLRTFRHTVEDATGPDLSGNTKLLRNVGLASAGVAVLAVGVVVGRELRQRYKFNRRTPYDAYAHAGDFGHDVECGVGI